MGHDNAAVRVDVAMAGRIRLEINFVSICDSFELESSCAAAQKNKISEGGSRDSGLRCETRGVRH